MEKSQVYQEKRSYLRYDAEHIIGYLNEEILTDYQPETESGEENTTVWPTAYKYTGTEADGGTILPCGEITSAGDLANAIIRSKYNESQEMAIHRHASNGDYETSSKEWDEYNSWCVNAVLLAKAWFAN